LGVAVFKGAFDFAASLRDENYCPEKEELKIQQELHVRAFAADKDSINKARAWGSWAFTTLTLLDGLNAMLQNAGEAALASVEKEAVKKAEQAALNVTKQKTLQAIDKGVLECAKKKAIKKTGNNFSVTNSIAGAGGGVIKRSSQSAGVAGGARGGGAGGFISSYVAKEGKKIDWGGMSNSMRKLVIRFRTIAPKNWIVMPPKNGKGIKYVNPKNSHDYIRFSPANLSPKAAPGQRGDYFERLKDGKYLTITGEWIEGGCKETKGLYHIPQTSFDAFKDVLNI